MTEDRYGMGAIGASIVMVATEAWVLNGALFLRSQAHGSSRDRPGRADPPVGATLVHEKFLTSEWPLGMRIAIG